MGNALPRSIADYLETPVGSGKVNDGTVWFRWNTRTGTIDSSGHVLKSTPEQMSRPGTAVFLRIGDGGWKRYC